MAYHFLPKLQLPEADTEKSTIYNDVGQEFNCYQDNESKNKDDQLSEKSVEKNIFTQTERAHIIKNNKVLKGYTGKIKSYKSRYEGILEFKIKKHLFISSIFKDKVVHCTKHNQSLSELWPSGTIIHFNAKWSQKSNSYKVTKLWNGTESRLQKKTQIMDENCGELQSGRVYKAIVTEVNNHSFTATVKNNLKSFKVFVKGDVYQPSFTSKCLKRKEQISLFVRVGDEVCLCVQMITEKHFKHSWYAVKAWKQNIPQEKVYHKVSANKFKIGTVTEVFEIKGTLTCDGMSLTFSNFSSHLFGVNLDGINLNEIFQKGDEVRFIPGPDMLIAQVWYGNTDIIDEDIYLNFTKFCMSRCVPGRTVTQLTMKLAELKKQNAESLVPAHNKTKKSQGKKNACSVIKEGDKNMSGMQDLSNNVQSNDCSGMFLIKSEAPNLEMHAHDSTLPQFTDSSTQTNITGDVTPLSQLLQQILYVCMYVVFNSILHL